MRRLSFVPLIGALALGAVLLTPTESAGWKVLGGRLDTETQRDVRVFNNFQDPEANDNTTPDPDWPGYVGAELAIWKACSEWTSEPHNNNGAGDPYQPGDLGGSGANFDISWQGNASKLGNANSNIHAEIGGSLQGIYAYTELPASNGWRIRYFREPWAWNDGPGTAMTGVNPTDLQGIATHEYGHALGLDHSNVPGATMAAGVFFLQSFEHRSIEADDRAGAQFIYLPLDLNKKAHVSSLSQSNGVVTITGTKFSLTPGSNEVWFTRAGSSQTGEPVKVKGLTATAGGTQLSCPVPADAGPGDLVVRNADIGGPKGLSNQVAFAPACGVVVSYCTAGTSASGCRAVLSATGTPSASASSGFRVTATGVEGARDGIFYYGTNGPQAHPWGGGTSRQCVVPPVSRAGLLTGVGTQGACDGSFSQDLNALWASKPWKNPGSGAVVQCQLWYADPASTSHVKASLSDGLTFSVCP